MEHSLELCIDRPTCADTYSLLAFHTSGIGRPRDVSLIPFYRIAHERYNLYWKVSRREGA